MQGSSFDEFVFAPGARIPGRALLPGGFHEGVFADDECFGYSLAATLPDPVIVDHHPATRASPGKKEGDRRAFEPS